jgi:hypothetical protein
LRKVTVNRPGSFLAPLPRLATLEAHCRRLRQLVDELEALSARLITQAEGRDATDKS